MSQQKLKVEKYRQAIQNFMENQIVSQNVKKQLQKQNSIYTQGNATLFFLYPFQKQKAQDFVQHIKEICIKQKQLNDSLIQKFKLINKQIIQLESFVSKYQRYTKNKKNKSQIQIFGVTNLLKDHQMVEALGQIYQKITCFNQIPEFKDPEVKNNKDEVINRPPVQNATCSLLKNLTQLAQKVVKWRKEQLQNIKKQTRGKNQRLQNQINFTIESIDYLNTQKLKNNPKAAIRYLLAHMNLKQKRKNVLSNNSKICKTKKIQKYKRKYKENNQIRTRDIQKKQMLSLINKKIIQYYQQSHFKTYAKACKNPIFLQLLKNSLLRFKFINIKNEVKRVKTYPKHIYIWLLNNKSYHQCNGKTCKCLLSKLEPQQVKSILSLKDQLRKQIQDYKLFPCLIRRQRQISSSADSIGIQNEESFSQNMQFLSSKKKK